MSNTPSREMSNGVRVRAKYNEWHDRFSASESTEAPWHTLVRSHLTGIDIDNRAVLEIGCGRGGFACALTILFPTARLYVAADLSDSALIQANLHSAALQTRRPCWTAADIEALPFSNDTFDTVISCETIEHVPHPRLALRELGRVLKPGGRLFLTTPNYLGPIGIYRGYLRATGRRYSEVGQPINNFMLLPLTCHQISAAGLKICNTEAVGHYLPFPGRPPIRLAWLDSRLLRWFGLHSFVVAEKVPAIDSASTQT